MVSPAEFQRAQAATAQGVLLLVRRQWDRMGSLDDWPQIAARTTTLTAAGQFTAAQRGVNYARDTLDVEPVGVVNPRAFAGIAPDGRRLDTLLYSSVVHARNTYAKVEDQLESGRKWLSMLAHTAVADAGRGATHAQLTATPQAGYLRMVNPPCCQRCAILAGKFFRWDTGFERHPRCDCTHVPTTGQTPDGYVADIALSQIHDLTDAQRKAVEDGADLNQVLNAYRHRIADREGYMSTSEGTTRSGWASYVQREVARQRGETAQETSVSVGRRGAVEQYNVRRTPRRLTPEAIYRTARSREEAVRLLAFNGYLVGDLRGVARLAG